MVLAKDGCYEDAGALEELDGPGVLPLAKDG